jgi:hypothetical protein
VLEHGFAQFSGRPRPRIGSRAGRARIGQGPDPNCPRLEQSERNSTTRTDRVVGPKIVSNCR